MFRIGILDGETLELQTTRMAVQTWFGRKKISYQLETYKSIKEADEELDVLVMEAEIDGEPVIKSVKNISKKYPLMLVIIVTGSDKYRELAQELHCYSYILKKELKRKLPPALEDAFNHAETLRLLQNKGRISFRTTRHYLSVPREDVLYFKFRNRRVRAITKDKEYIVHHTLKELADMVGEGFSFCHRSCLVNLEHVRTIFGVTVTMDTGEELVLSQKRGKIFRQALKDFAHKGLVPAKKNKTKRTK